MSVLHSKKGLLFLLVLLILSGISIWAVQTQRLELRKKAAIPEGTVCGNRLCEAGEADDPGGCGPNADPGCLGPPARKGTCPQDCQPTCTPRPICLDTPGSRCYPQEPLEGWCPPTPTFTPTPTPPGVASPIELRLKFAGVTDGSAQGAQVTARFVRNDVNLVTPPFSLNHVGNGVYAATLGFTGLSVPPGPGYSIIIKGEKHVARKFCADGQTAPCQGNQSLTMPGATNLTRIFDFTGLTLDPGDLPPQDGKADMSDFDVVKSMLSKPCSSLTTQDKKIADLDYNGCIDIGDAFLMRKTLETRYDEN